MNIIKNFVIVLILSLFTLNNAMAANVSGRPTVYINTVHAFQLCETGSTLANCLRPVIVGESVAGQDMDLGVVGSTANFGNAGLIPSGKTYTHGQVIMARTFTIAGSLETVAGTTCNTGGAAGATNAGGATNSQSILNQVLWATDGTGNGDQQNSTSAVVNGTDAVAGTMTNGHAYMKFRWALSKPLNVTFGKIPTMTIAFDLSTALNFNDGGNGACDGNDFYPGRPVITNTFE